MLGQHLRRHNLIMNNPKFLIAYSKMKRFARWLDLDTYFNKYLILMIIFQNISHLWPQKNIDQYRFEGVAEAPKLR